jgi:hypothetical protein
VQLPEENEQVAPAELHSILKRLHRILIKRFVLCIAMALCITGECYSSDVIILDISKFAGSSQEETFSKH